MNTSKETPEMVKKQYKFSFPPLTIHKPLIYHLSRDFDVIPNIMKGRITEDAAWLEVELEGDAQKMLNTGDKAWLIPYELGASVNQYDYFRAAKNGKLEGFWPISARGRLA